MFAPLAAIQYPAINPVIVQLGPIAIRWYGLAYVAGLAICYQLLLRMQKAGKLAMTRDDLADLIGWLALGVVGGGRTGWWLFYHKSQAGVVEPWWEPIAIWHGGMSFHGGLLGVMLVLFVWTRRKKIDLWPVMDVMARLAPIGLFFGRIANFINAELVGRPTTVPWGVIFPGDTFARHPSQLYEAFLEGPALLGAMYVWHKAVGHRRTGTTAAAFLIVYGIFRFVVEFTREPDVQLGYIAWGWLTMGQLLSAGIVAAGAGVLIWRIKRAAGEVPPVV